MPIVSPIPLGGCASELGDLTSQIRALEQGRFGQAIAATYTTSFLCDTSTWTTPTGWDALDFGCFTTVGGIIMYGAQLTSATGGGAGSAPEVLTRVVIDGDETHPIAGSSGSEPFGGPDTVQMITGFTLLPDGVTFTVLPLGSHTVELQAAMFDTSLSQTCTLSFAYLAIWML